MMLNNRRSLTTQIGLMMIKLDNNAMPDVKKIYRMPALDLNSLYSELKQKIATNFYMEED